MTILFHSFLGSSSVTDNIDSDWVNVFLVRYSKAFGPIGRMVSPTTSRERQRIVLLACAPSLRDGWWPAKGLEADRYVREASRELTLQLFFLALAVSAPVNVMTLELGPLVLLPWGEETPPACTRIHQ